MKGCVLIQKSIITKLQDFIDEILKILFSRIPWPISIIFSKKHPWAKGIQICSNDGSRPFSSRIQDEFDNKIVKKNILTKFKNLRIKNCMDHFQQYFLQSILGWRGFKILQMKDHSLFYLDLVRIRHYFDEILKNPILQDPWANFSKTWHKASLGEGDSIFSNWRIVFLCKGIYSEITNKIVKIHNEI